MLPVPNAVLRLLLARQLKWEDGRINVLGLYTYITPIETFEYLTNYFNKGKQKDLLYLSGWIAGYEIVKNLMRNYKAKKPEDRYTLAMDFLEIGGYGKYKTIQFIPGVRSRFIYLTNPLPMKFYPAKEFKCDYIRGLNGGGGTWVHKKLVNCIELECAAVNSNYCEFINFCYDDKETLEKYKKLVKGQFYNLKEIIKIQKDYIKKRKDDKEISLP